MSQSAFRDAPKMKEDVIVINASATSLGRDFSWHPQDSTVGLSLVYDGTRGNVLSLLPKRCPVLREMDFPCSPENQTFRRTLEKHGIGSTGKWGPHHR